MATGAVCAAREELKDDFLKGFQAFSIEQNVLNDEVVVRGGWTFEISEIESWLTPRRAGEATHVRSTTVVALTQQPDGSWKVGRVLGLVRPMKETLKAGVLYFALVFAAGFVLGTIRTLWVVPRLGVRTAELIEAPVMLGVSVLAARWVVRRFGVPPFWPRRLAMGCIALGLMFLAELTVVLSIRGMTIRVYFETRDPVSGAAYFLALGAFAVVPILVARPRS